MRLQLFSLHESRRPPVCLELLRLTTCQFAEGYFLSTSINCWARFVEGCSGIDVKVPSTENPEMLVWVHACADEVQNFRQTVATNTVLLKENPNNETSERSGQPLHRDSESEIYVQRTWSKNSRIGTVFCRCVKRLWWASRSTRKECPSDDWKRFSGDKCPHAASYRRTN